MRRTSHPKSKGVSTVIGMSIFFLIFATTVAYAFIWSQNLAYYVEAAHEEFEFKQLQASESLVVKPLNETRVSIYNPTGNVIVITQIWSDHSLVYGTQTGIAPFSTWVAPNDDTHRANGNFTVVTIRGNVFSGSYVDEFANMARRAWHVAWYGGDMDLVRNDYIVPSQLTSQNLLGESYWYDLNFEWSWNDYSVPIIGDNKNNVTHFVGFVANATLIKTTGDDQDMIINFIIGAPGGVNFMLNDLWYEYPDDPGLRETWIDSTITVYLKVTGEKYSVHKISVFFIGGEDLALIGNEYDQYLRINVINAAFLP